MHPLWPHPLVLDFCHSDSSQYCVFVLCFFSCRWPYLDTRVQYKLLANQWTSTDADIQPVRQDILTSILEGVFVVFLVLSLHILYEVSGYFYDLKLLMSATELDIDDIWDWSNALYSLLFYWTDWRREIFTGLFITIV